MAVCIPVIEIHALAGTAMRIEQALRQGSSRTHSARVGADVASGRGGDLLRLDKLSYDIHMVAEEMLQRGMIDVEAPGSVRVGSAAH
jgi:hypothetical protein